MLIALTIYIIGFLACFGYLAYDEIKNGDFQAPFIAYGLLAAVIWPLFLLLVFQIENSNNDPQD